MTLPVVAIIGRPNVGKSTLFNKLVGKRIAITQNTPGVTRDRIYQEVEWQNQYFLLMDTGGLEVHSSDIFAQNIEMQVDIALDSADLILFLVDGREGLLAQENEIAQKIRQSNKPCLVVINKVDSPDIPNTAYDFYRLGFDDYCVISAEQSRGLGDLLDKIFSYFPDPSQTEKKDMELPIALIGKPNVGKSSLVNCILEENRIIVTNIPGTTRDSIDSYYTRNGKSYKITDTAGIRRKRSIDHSIEHYSVVRSYDAIDRSDICLFLLDASFGITEQDTKISGYAHDQLKASIIVVNKWDLMEKATNSQRDFEIKIRNNMTFNPYAPIVFISVKEKKNIDKLFDTIDMVDEAYSFRMSTGVLNDIIRDSLAMNPPPTDKGKRLKIYYASQVTTRPAKIILYVNERKLLHFSYLRYLENQIRKNFSFIGCPLQLEVRERRE